MGRLGLVGMNGDDSLATILLTGRLREDRLRPLKASEFWTLRDQGVEIGALRGCDRAALVASHGLPELEADRIVELMARATGMAFELTRLQEFGVSALTPFDGHYPGRFAERLGRAAPPLVYAAGKLELLNCPGVGVVGSRDVAPEGAEVAAGAGRCAAGLGLPLISGGARGVDQIAMNAAEAAGGEVVGVLADPLIRKLRNSDVRRAIHDGRTVMCTPYNPEAPFTAGGAMGRNRLIYALARVTLVVAADAGSGGTWSGAQQALKGGFGRVAVWRGPGEGPGNEELERRGAEPVKSLDELEEIVLTPDDLPDRTPIPPSTRQPTLFEPPDSDRAPSLGF